MMASACGTDSSSNEINESSISDNFVSGPLPSNGEVINEFELTNSQKSLEAFDSVTTNENQATENAIDFLGRGYVPNFSRIREHVFETSYKQFKEKHTVMEGIHITKSHDYLKIIDKKASGKASGWLGEASGGASSKYSIKKSSDEEIFAATVSVAKNRYTINKYRLTKEAKKVLKNNPKDFEGLYGSSAISEVTTGAECLIIFRFKAKSSQELQQLKQKAKASSGFFNVSAKASFNRTIRELSAMSTMSYSIVVRGVDEIPKDHIDSALAYFFKFPELADKSKHDVILSSNFSNFSKIPALNKYDINSKINYEEVDKMQAAITAALNMTVEANSWLDDIHTVLNPRNTKLYSEATKNQARNDEAKATLIIEKLETFIDDIRIREKISNPSMLVQLEFDRQFYAQVKKPAKPPRRVTKDDGNIAADRGGAHFR
jgi:hypothetical protein